MEHYAGAAEMTKAVRGYMKTPTGKLDIAYQGKGMDINSSGGFGTLAFCNCDRVQRVNAAFARGQFSRLFLDSTIRQAFPSKLAFAHSNVACW